MFFLEKLCQKFRDWRLLSNPDARRAVSLIARNISSAKVNVSSEKVEAALDMNGRKFRIVMPRHVPYTIYADNFEISEDLSAKINSDATLEIKWFLIKRELVG